MTKLTAADLAAETVELLPDRDTLFSIDLTKTTNWAAIYASNNATAVNVLNLGHSEANAFAAQYVTTSQH